MKSKIGELEEIFKDQYLYRKLTHHTIAAEGMASFKIVKK